MGSSRGKYKTKQQELILAFLKDAEGEHVTADTIANALSGRVGLTTIYRKLDELSEEGAVIKYEAPGLGACYRYTGGSGGENGTYHFLCTGCGEISHLNCERLGELSKHVNEEHGICLDSRRTVLYGSCQSCNPAKGRKTEGICE